jgi:hypothetical protein
MPRLHLAQGHLRNVRTVAYPLQPDRLHAVLLFCWSTPMAVIFAVNMKNMRQSESYLACFKAYCGRFVEGYGPSM